MKKFKNLKFKIFAFISAFVCLLSTFVVSSYAWSENADGNLVSDNLLNLDDVPATTRSGITYSVSNGTVYLNGTSTKTVFVIINQSFTIGTYTWALFNSTIQYDSSLVSLDNNLRVELRNGTSGVALSSQVFFDSVNKTKTFNLNINTDSVYIRIASGTTLDNFTFRPMLVSGNVAPVSYEPYGKVYYSNDVYVPVSKLFYGNLSKAYMSYYINGGANLYNFGFVYDGILGYASGTDTLPQWNEFNNSFSSLYESKIVSPYGMFYHTDWSIYDFIEEESDYIYSAIYQDKPFTLVYEFALPQDFTDSYFDSVGFNSINFYDVNGVLLYNNASPTSFNVTLQGVRTIECILNNAGDIADDDLYLMADVFAGYYNLGYQNGYAVGSSLNDSFYNSGYELGYNTGMNDFMNGIYTNSNSYNYGFDEGYESGSGNSYNTGFAAGYAQARADTSWIDNSTANATDLFWTIGSTPWESFKHIWNINFLGINLANVITGFVTALIVIWLIKKVWK